MIDRIARRFGDKLASTGCELIVQAVGSFENQIKTPQQVTLELTPHRSVDGPITPQHHARLDREPISTDAALRIVEQLGAIGDVSLTLGGLGDALLHDDWTTIVQAAHAAGVSGICIETDFIVERDVCQQLLDMPVDVISVRLNADTPESYAAVMGRDAFTVITKNIEWMLNQRNKRSAGAAGIPWIVPRLIKCSDTIGDMEKFFDRWMHFLGHAVIEPVRTGCGLRSGASDLIAEPRRLSCRQITGDRNAGGRMTIHSDGAVPHCDEDWHGSTPAGNAFDKPVAEIWNAIVAAADGESESLKLCDACQRWYGLVEEDLLLATCS